DGNVAHITREPEQVKAYRDTWRDGIHSYLTYLRDRLTVARDLLADSGSIFVQIGDENVHRVRALMDEVFGERNFCSLVTLQKTTGAGSPAIGTDVLPAVNDYLLWYCRDIADVKYRQLYLGRAGEGWVNYNYVRLTDVQHRRMTKQESSDWRRLPPGARVYRRDNLTSSSSAGEASKPVTFHDQSFSPGKAGWKTSHFGVARLGRADRLESYGATLSYRRFADDYPFFRISNLWNDVLTGGYAEQKLYVVQTLTKIVERCLLMTTDPGDLVVDPTCGSGTTAYVAEEWGRRWITIDTSRVALALARARIMGARHPYYILADSREGQLKEAEITRTAPSEKPMHGSVRHGFVYDRVPHITLKSIANNAEIDVIWEKRQATLEPLREQLNAALHKQWEEWQIPREADPSWNDDTKELHERWWQARIARQKEIDASIAAKAEFEYLYDKPYIDNRKVRVAGPFTVESVSPHRALDLDEDGDFIGRHGASRDAEREATQTFPQMILENLRTAGVQQAHKEDRITFTSLTPWPGDLVCAEGRYFEGDTESGTEKRAAIFIGPEFGTVSRADLVDATREAADAGFDVLIACAFNYEAHKTEFNKLGRVPVLKARMNADLHMADDLKNSGKGNLFVIFGEPDIDVLPADDGRIWVKVNGVDVFHPSTGEVRSDSADGIACWFIDSDYNQESFFVRQAYFLGANDPYGALKTTLRAEIDEAAWTTLNSDTSRSFEKPASGRIAVKVINHLGDEVMKVFRVH
ncbi:MAG: site-specific DNA-methyltransferase, partial [Chloroflexi bacterium]